MASAGYKSGVSLSTNGTTWTELDGIKSFTFTMDRVVLDITDFKTTGIDREKIMGLRDASFQISGDFVGGDAGQEIFLDAQDDTSDNPALYIKIMFDATYGVSCKITAESSEIGAEVEGLVTFSASGTQNGTFTRIP